MRAGRIRCLALIVCFVWCGTVHRVLNAQEVVKLPAPPTILQPAAEPFSFVSDGPTGAGWSRPDEIARAYFHDDLPALFERTIVLSQRVPIDRKSVV